MANNDRRSGINRHTSLDKRLAELAATQHGVVELGQLRILGLSAGGVQHRVSAGRLHRVHRGVYAVGHAVLGREGRWMAAVLACGPGAVLSHRSAAALWGVRFTSRSVIDVTLGRPTRRARPGIEIHRTRTLRPRDTTRHHGVPCTTVARTLLDLAALIDRRSLERACEQAEILRLLDLHALIDVLDRAAGRRGATALRSVLATYADGGPLTRSELEERLLEACERFAIPPPRVNALVRVGGDPIEVDFSWPGQSLIVEVDGYRTHGTRGAFCMGSPMGPPTCSRRLESGPIHVAPSCQRIRRCGRHDPQPAGVLTTPRIGSRRR
jgi:hypothetical protein